MKRLRLLLAAAAVLLPAAHGYAHPMGNISVNHYAGLEMHDDGVVVKYLLDFAEIPAYRELEAVDPDKDDVVTPEEREAYLDAKTTAILQTLKLDVNGTPLALERRWSRVTFPPGEGGLSTVRIAWELFAPWKTAPAAKTFLVWNDGNYADHPGWKEIRFAAADGLSIGRSSLRAQPESDELGRYPEEYLDNPPTETKAWCLFGPGLSADEASDFEPPSDFGGTHRKDRLVALLSAERLSPGVLVVSFLLAILLGAAHALEPGHGKTLVAAYLVGSHGTVAQAVLLGLVVTFTHTFSVLLLGVLVLFLSAHFVPATLFPWLGFGSGVLIALVGLSLLRSRWREWRAIRAPARAHDHAHDHTHGHPHEHPHDHGHGHDHAHSHGPDHHHDHDTHTHAPADAAHGHSHRHGPEHSGHSHVPAGQPTLRGILALGVSGGLVPCPAGIVVLLAAVASGRIGFGLLLILAFSVGLAAVLVGVGVLCVTARRFFDRIPASGAFARRLGVASAVFVTLFGIGLAVRSLGAPLG